MAAQRSANSEKVAAMLQDEHARAQRHEERAEKRFYKEATRRRETLDAQAKGAREAKAAKARELQDYLRQQIEWGKSGNSGIPGGATTTQASFPPSPPGKGGKGRVGAQMDGADGARGGGSSGGGGSGGGHGGGSVHPLGASLLTHSGPQPGERVDFAEENTHSKGRMLDYRRELSRQIAEKELVGIKRREQELEEEQAQLAELREQLKRKQLERLQKKEHSQLTMRMLWDAQVQEKKSAPARR